MLRWLNSISDFGLKYSNFLDYLARVDIYIGEYFIMNKKSLQIPKHQEIIGKKNYINF